jgi:hypothetical protein
MKYKRYIRVISDSGNLVSSGKIVCDLELTDEQFIEMRQDIFRHLTDLDLLQDIELSSSFDFRLITKDS